ncbi:Ribosome biogenesis protein [Trichinella pseudospiralis]
MVDLPRTELNELNVRNQRFGFESVKSDKGNDAVAQPLNDEVHMAGQVGLILLKRNIVLQQTNDRTSVYFELLPKRRGSVIERPIRRSQL